MRCMLSQAAACYVIVIHTLVQAATLTSQLASDTAARRRGLEKKATTPLCHHLQQAAVDLATARYKRQPFKNMTVSTWPSNCSLPMKVGLSRQGSQADVTVRSLTDAKRVDEVWRALPPAGILVLELQDGAEQRAAVTDLIWRSHYAVHSRILFEEFQKGFSSSFFGLSGLKYTTVFGNHLLLQKEADFLDTEASAGKFLRKAREAGTDKVDSFHNYSCLYHRHLDSWPAWKKGALLEIGLGCGQSYGPGASAQIWADVLPSLSIHFVEINASCAKTWKSTSKAMAWKNAAVARVAERTNLHIGSQKDVPFLCAVVDGLNRSEPGGLQVVVDDGSHDCAHIIASFRALFPHIKSGGLYFVEDIMYSAWGTRGRQQVAEPSWRTKGTPISLASVLASAAIGAASVTDAKVHLQQLEQPKHHREIWIYNVLIEFGDMVSMVQCTPGICVFQRK
mmetsp:Transcript_88058/g.161230  ORF Transcript_88058/g.161230 Transcript_88058/m.161230 type:complete len:451 (+) Transcript_88058:117-1469(+)